MSTPNPIQLLDEYNRRSKKKKQPGCCASCFALVFLVVFLSAGIIKGIYNEIKYGSPYGEPKKPKVTYQELDEKRWLEK